ncbi:hypothetical protein AA313_de0202616 [Arthrobotrys entomopaga]|nr:hypothetical protein AA313_de0202616 [Arthrobotrys entomopaga]
MRVPFRIKTTLRLLFTTMATVFSLDDLPPAYEVAQAFEIFFASTKALYYITTRAMASELFNQIYLGTDPKKSNAQLSEVCALAAVGTVYNNETVLPTPLGLSERLINTAKIHLDECIDDDILTAMRIASLCSVYYCMQKKTAAVTYAISGLQIARLIVAKRDEGEIILEDKNWEEFHRIVQTVSFIYTQESLTATELDNADDMEELSQRELAKISVITTQMLQQCYANSAYDTDTIENHLLLIQDWFMKLPPTMKLGSLLNYESPRVVRPFFLAHLIHLTSVILLTRKVFIDVATEKLQDEGLLLGQEKYFHGSSESASSYSSECLLAAAHVSRIVAIALSEKLVFKRCWAAIHSTYIACQLLLYSAARRLYLSPGLQLDLEPLAGCFTVLEFCSTVDTMSVKYEQSIRGFYDKVRELNTEGTILPESDNQIIGDVRNIPVDLEDSLSVEILKSIIHPIAAVHSGGFNIPWNAPVDQPIRRPDNVSPPNVDEVVPTFMRNSPPLHPRTTTLAIPEESLELDTEGVYQFFQRSF